MTTTKKKPSLLTRIGYGIGFTVLGVWVLSNCARFVVPSNSAYDDCVDRAIARGALTTLEQQRCAERYR